MHIQFSFFNKSADITFTYCNYFTPFPLLYSVSPLLLNNIIMMYSNFLPQHAQAYAEENGLLFMETSAKTGRNIETIFHAIGKAIHNQWE